MKCSKIKRRISAYIDGEVPEHERNLISEHLQQCEECAVELAALSAATDALNEIKGIEVPPFFMTRLRQNIREQTETVSIRQKIKRLVFSAVTAFAVIASVLVGNQAGKILYSSIARTHEPAVAETGDVFGLGAFEEFPDGSLSDIYYELITGGDNG